MTAKEGKEAHYSRGRRHLPPAAAVAGLVVLAFCWSLSGSGPRPLQTVELSEEQLEQLVARVQSPHVALQHAVARRYGPTAPPSTRGGKYVVTSVMGLDPERLNIFVASLRRWSPATRLVVFVEERTDATLLREAGATVFPFVARNDSALVLNRFEMYRAFLKDLKDNDSEAGVMLTDSRDVLVQSDPWQHPLIKQLIDEDAMLFSLEGGLAVGEVPLKAQPQNEHWVDTCFGPEVMAELADAPISCAGVTVGSVSAMYSYVTQLLKVAYGTAHYKYYGSDQAVHNYLLHYLGPRGNLTFPYHVRRNWDSPVHTAGYGWPIVIDVDGVYRRVQGDTPPLVHQYDRAYEATKVYLDMYPIQRSWSTAGFRWDGPPCVKNLLLNTVTACPPDPPTAQQAAAQAAARQGTAEGERGGGGGTSGGGGEDEDEARRR